MKEASCEENVPGAVIRVQIRQRLVRQSNRELSVVRGLFPGAEPGRDPLI
jgi:hypothetical protein